MQRRGFKVAAAQLPLTSLTDDATALRRVLRRQDTPVVLVGHAHGGAVVTAAAGDDPQVKALVYVTAIVADKGETVGEIFGRVAPYSKAPKLQPDSDGQLWVTAYGLRDAIAPDAYAEETILMAAIQKAIALECLGERMTQPALKRKPSWFLIAENDRMVAPETQHYMAERMKFRIVSLPIDHSPMASRPDAVIGLISDAATGI